MTDWTTRVEKVRPKVVEYRLSLFYGDYQIRAWFEGDPEFGGLGLVETHKAWEKAFGEDFVNHDPHYLCETLLERCPTMNSVEVCNVAGNGVCMHRNWP